MRKKHLSLRWFNNPVKQLVVPLVQAADPENPIPGADNPFPFSGIPDNPAQNPVCEGINSFSLSC